MGKRVRDERIQDPDALEARLPEFFERDELCDIAAFTSIVDD